MKAIVLFIALLLNNSIYAQSQPNIKDKLWYLTKLEINNQTYNRPVNTEANTKSPNFYIQSSTTNMHISESFCYHYSVDYDVLDEQLQVLYCRNFTYLTVPQECNLQENNDFDLLNDAFWINTDNTRDPYINPYRFDYEVIEVNNGSELIITNESGDKAYYNDVTASADIFKKLPVKTYPNPVQSVLNIELPSTDYQNVLIDIYDVTGKKIKSFKESWQENINLNMEGLPDGNYLLELKLPNESGRGHFVKIIKE